MTIPCVCMYVYTVKTYSVILTNIFGFMFQGIRLFVEICDFDSNNEDDLIDILQIDIADNSLNIGEETNVTVYSGKLGYSTVNLSFSIQCLDNFRGSTCSECVPGYNGSLCDINIDECGSVNCGEHGVCVDEVNSFSCICSPGFTGPLCNEIEGKVIDQMS